MSLAKCNLIMRFTWLYSLSLFLPTAYFNPRRDVLLKEWQALSLAESA